MHGHVHFFRNFAFFMDYSLTYIYHSCFLLECSKFLLVFDYWRDRPDGFLRQRVAESEVPVYAFVSHFHEDHFNPEILSLSNRVGEPLRCLLSYDVVKKRRIPPEKAVAVLRPEVAVETPFFRLQPFRSTDVGVSAAVSLPDGTVLFHAGDLNNWYFPEQPSQMRVSLRGMEGLFLSVIRSVKGCFPKIDHLMFPVDPRLGAETLRGAVQLLERIPVRHFYPMHFWERAVELKSLLEELSTRFPGTEFHDC